MANGVRSRLLLGTICGGMAMLSAPGALAQAAPDGDDQDIVVTAQARSERLQDVPIQVSVLTAETIANAGIKSTGDALAQVSNVTFDRGNTYRSTFITMRGLTQLNNADPPVAVVIDGVPQTDQTQLGIDLFDIERIEVVKGPQGALYGRNAVGGAINIVTRMPTDRLEGFGNFSYGNGDAVQAAAGISGPIAENLLFRVTGSFSRSDGLIDNSFRHDKVDFLDHDWSVRGRLLYKPASNLSVDLRADYGKFRGASNTYSAVFSGNPNDFVDPQFNLPGSASGDNLNLTGKIDLDLDFATLTSITGHTELTQVNRADLDYRNPVNSPSGIFGLGFQAGQGQDLDLKTTSQEVRLVSASDQAFRWLVGGYYIHTDRSLLTRAFVDVTGDVSQIDNPALLFANQSEANDNNAYAAFAQLDFDVTDWLMLTGGLRYDKDRRNQRNVLTNAERKASFDHLQPKVTVTFKPTDGLLAYATFSTGFRSGGYNAPNVVVPIFPQETLKNYEAGFKSQFLDRKLTINGAFFWTDVTNYQYFYVDASTASQIISSIDAVRIKGIELEVLARPVRGLELSGSIGTTDTRIRRGGDPADIGNRSPRTVPFTANAGAQYTLDLGDGSRMIARADYQHIGKKYWGSDNTDVQRPYDLVNLRFGFERGNYGIFGFGKNILNAKYYSEYVSSKYSGLDVDLGYRGQPATYGVEARIKF
ncbi:TonB-dependent receptor [soil metagenome]